MTRIVYYTLVILIITSFALSVIADDTKSYIVILKEGYDADAHYEWVKNEQKKTTVRMNTDEAQTADLNEVLKTFSIGSVNGYASELSESWVTNVLAKRSDVESVDLNGKTRIFAPIKPTCVDKKPQINIDMSDTTAKPLLDNSFKYPKSAGKGVKVYVIDTGVRATHVEFEGRAKMAKVICKGCPNADDHGHGTHVSGTIAGHTVGVSKQVHIFGVKVYTKYGEGSWDDLIAGLQFVADEKKADKSGIFVVNISAGGPKFDPVNKVVEQLSKLQIHIVVAAGNNDGQDACVLTPASAKSAITVAAVAHDQLTNAPFSDVGPCVDIFAPGTDVNSSYNEGDKSYTTMSGTSMASPHGAGIVSLILAEKGDMSSDDLAKFIKTKALAGKIKFIPNTLKGTPNLFASIHDMF